MELMQQLSVLAVYQFLGDRADSLMKFLDNRFTDHSSRLEMALRRANDRAWRTLEVALAGDSWWSACKNVLTPSDEKNLQQQVRTFLASLQPADLPGNPDAYRKTALAELRSARRVNYIPGDRFSPAALATEARTFASASDPLARIEQDRKHVADMAEVLRKEKYTTLAHYIELRPRNGDALLVAAVRYFFRREVETDDILGAGLTTVRLEGLASGQKAGFDGLHDALVNHGQRLEVLLVSVTEVLAEVRKDTAETLSQVGDTRENVVAMRAELERQREELHQMTQLLKRLLEQPASQQTPATPPPAAPAAPPADPNRVIVRQPPPVTVAQPPPVTVAEPPPLATPMPDMAGEWQQVRQLLARCRTISTQQVTSPELAKVVGKFEEAARTFESTQKTYLERMEEAKTESGLPVYPKTAQTPNRRTGRVLSPLFDAAAGTPPAPPTPPPPAEEPPRPAEEQPKPAESAARRRLISPLFENKPKKEGG